MLFVDLLQFCSLVLFLFSGTLYTLHTFIVNWLFTPPPPAGLILHSVPFLLGLWQYCSPLIASYRSSKESSPFTIAKNPINQTSLLIFLALWPWESHFTFMALWFLFVKIGLDCLTSRVYSKSKDQSLSPLPVLFFIHSMRLK